MEDKKLAYIPVPKAASSSIRSLFMQHETGSELHAEKTDRYRRTRRELKRTIRHSIHPSQFSEIKENYFLFSFVRNPLTRLFSCYQSIVVEAEMKTTKCSFQPYGISFGISFDNFVKKVSEIPDNIANQHFRSASAFLTDGEDLLVDYVGKLEQFKPDWQLLSDQFGLPYPPKTHRVSLSPVQIQDIPISNKSLNMLMERYSKDIELFGYRESLVALLKHERS
jgi:hypothetical protein